jgi:hypothetical protein
VDLKNKALDVVYYTQEELDVQVLEQEQAKVLTYRVSSITEYAQAQDETGLSVIEDSILQIELNKILNGGM